MLRTLKSANFLTRPGIGGVGVGDDSKARYNNKVNNEVDNKDEVRKKGQNLSKFKNLFKFKKTESGFFISRARMAFTQRRQAFIKALILYHFDLEYHIQVEIDESSYAIGGVFNQLTSDNLG